MQLINRKTGETDSIYTDLSDDEAYAGVNNAGSVEADSQNSKNLY